jgi:hypothetical protein
LGIFDCCLSVEPGVSPVEGEYTTPNTKKRIRSSTSTPGSTDKQQSKIPKPF